MCRIRDRAQNLKKPPKFEELMKKLNERISKWYSKADYNGVEHVSCFLYVNSLVNTNSEIRVNF